MYLTVILNSHNALFSSVCHFFFLLQLLRYLLVRCYLEIINLSVSHLADTSYTILFHVIDWCPYPLLVSGPWLSLSFPNPQFYVPNLLLFFIFVYNVSQRSLVLQAGRMQIFTKFGTWEWQFVFILVLFEQVDLRQIDYNIC